MVDWNKPVQTRDGRKVRVLCTDGPEPHVVVGFIEGSERPDAWTISGGWMYPGNPMSKKDALNAPEAKVVWVAWVNLYPSSVAGKHNSRKHADEAAGESRIACIRVTYTVGQFDDEPELEDTAHG